MSIENTSKSAREAYHEGTDDQFDAPELLLGPWTSYSLVHDPKHLCFVLARYKFCAKLLQGKKTIMEIGPGDCFGLPMLAQVAEHVYAVDWDERLLEGSARRLAHLENVTYRHLDLNETPTDFAVDAAIMVDVIEHIEPEREAKFMEHVVGALPANGVLVTGTPNLAASQYASEQSKIQHINLKSMDSLRTLMGRYFENVFTFGQNDEVVHTGYAPMCHYIWTLAVGVRADWKDHR